MTTLFDENSDDDFDLTPLDTSISERSIRAQTILDEIGIISLDIPHGVYTNAVEFVADMQDRLEGARARKQEFWVSERQLEWLEGIYEKVG
jgi:hypothetical protein